MHIRDSSGIFGAERVILTLAKSINRRAFQFNLMCMRRGNGSSDQLIETARRLEIPVFPVDVRGRFDICAMQRIRRIIQYQRISIIHTHDFKSDLYGLLASLGTPIKRVTTAHGSTRDSLQKRLYLYITERGIYRLFHKVIAVSEELHDYLVSLSLSASRISTIQNGMDFSLIELEGTSADHSPLPSVKGKVIFSVIGRLYPDKGHRFFIEAFEKVHQMFPNTAALIVGDGPGRFAIAKQIKRLGLDKAIHLCGVRSNMKAVYEMADYVVIPSLTEGLPYVLLEAMANGNPLIASRVGDIPISIVHGENGFLVNPGSVDELNKYMTRLMTNPDEGRAMASSAREIVLRDFSAKRMLDATEDIYRKLIN
jgi:glycosyltransferase involved in cell wall biosynthesis